MYVTSKKLNNYKIHIITSEFMSCLSNITKVSLSKQSQRFYNFKWIQKVC
jgi:hypothetical protein